MNKWEGIGNLTKDVELTKTFNDISFARFTIAVQRKYTNQDGEREADFINCVAWRNQAETLAKYCHKGDKIAVVGAIQTRSYEVNGEKKFATEIVADEIEFINIKKAEPVEQKVEQKPAGINTFTPIDDDNLPF